MVGVVVEVVEISREVVLPPAEHRHIDTLQLTQPDQVGPHQDPQLHPLLLPPLPLPRVALVLHSNPQLVHLGEVQLWRDGFYNFSHFSCSRTYLYKVNTVINPARILTLLKLARLKGVRQNVPEESRLLEMVSFRRQCDAFTLFKCDQLLR